MRLPMRNPAARVAATLAAVVLMTGCASAGSGPEGGPLQRELTVVVQNNNWQDANIFATGVGPDVRLGTVTSMDTKTFRVPVSARRPGEVQLKAALIGSSAVKITDPIMVGMDGVVHWTLQNQLTLSSYTVR